MASREFTSLSVSSYDAASLADQLTAKSAEGWEVVAIVPAGTNVTAYLSREAGAQTAASSTAATAAATAASTTAGSAADQWAQSSEPAAAVAQTAQPAAATESAAPAGWYADPAGRYELRYWDGGQWTEHVSRAGQQYTDPPVA